MKDAEATGSGDRSSLLILGAFVFVTIYTVNLFPRIPNPNEFSRYELVVSMAERRTFAIDRELSTLAGHEDKSFAGGHYYSNKAPGLSFAALPFYVVFRAFLGPPSPDNSARMIYLLRLATVSALSVLALLVLLRRLKRHSTDPHVPPLVLFAVAFGTPLLVYGRSFFSHAWTAALLYLSFELLFGGPGNERRNDARHLLAGLLAGWAVLSEYPCAVIAAVFLLAAAWKNPRRALLFAAGAIPAAALLAFYDLRCFGGIFEVSSRHEASSAYRSLSGERFVGFTWPRAAVAAQYLFSQTRGILFESPFFFVLPVATLSPKVRGRLAGICLAATVCFFVLMCGYENWHGGWALGPRYLLPALFLAAWPLAGMDEPESGRGAACARFFFVAAAVFSAAYFFFAASTFWAIPPEPASGLRFYSAFWIARGWWVPTLLGSGVAAQVPVWLATGVAAAAALSRQFPGRLRALTAVLAGVLAFALLFVGPAPRGTFGDRLARAMILDGDGEADPTNEEMRKVGSEALSPAQREAWRGAAARYRIVF